MTPGAAAAAAHECNGAQYTVEIRARSQRGCFEGKRRRRAESAVEVRPIHHNRHLTCSGYSEGRDGRISSSHRWAWVTDHDVLEADNCPNGASAWRRAEQQHDHGETAAPVDDARGDGDGGAR